MEVEERSLTAGVGKMGMSRLSERDGRGRKKCWGREGRTKETLRFEKQLTWVQKVVGLTRLTMMMLTLGVIRQRRKDGRAITNIVVAAPVDATEKLQGSHHKVPVYICLNIEEREKKKKRREEYGIGLG